MTKITTKRKRALLWPYIALLTLALTATGFWFMGAAQIKKSLHENPDINFSSLSVGGFPSQYRIIMADYVFRLPQGNLSGDSLTATRMFYNFNHTIIWAEGGIQFDGQSGDRLTLTGEALQASHVMTKEGEDYFADARISVDLQKPRFAVRPAFAEGMNITSEQIQFYSLPIEARQTRLLFDANNLAVTETDNQQILSLKKTIMEASLPANRNSITLDAMKLDINLSAEERLGIQGNGQLGRNEQGYLDGTLNLTFENMTSVLRILQTNGLLTADQVAILSFALQLKTGSITKGTSETDTFPLTLAFKQGRVFFGPLDIGPAPKL